MPRLLLLFIPVAFLLGFFIATIAEQRKAIARLLAVVTVVFLFLAMIMALMIEIREWVWLNDIILIVSWIASFATAIKYFRGSQERIKAFLASCLLIAAVTTFSLANVHVRQLIGDFLCSYVQCGSNESVMVETDFMLVDTTKTAVNVLGKGEKYNFIIADSFYTEDKHLIRLLPVTGSLQSDSIAQLTLSVWRQEKKIKTLNKCISRADASLEEYNNFEDLNDPRYESLEDLQKALNAAIVNEFNACDLGGCGLKFQFILPPKSSLSGEYDMRLEFLFKSGKRIFKQKKISFL